jgi:hypothetical protein
MSKAFVTVIVFGFLFCGCEANPGFEAGWDGDPANEVICYGDPDQSMLCRTRGEFFDCTAMPNGDLKCTNNDFMTPDGKSGWTCTASGDSVVCVKDSPNITGSGGWTCTSDGTTTTCTTTQPGTPAGGTGWTCTYVEGVGLVCTGAPTGDGAGESGSGGGASGSGGSGGPIVGAGGAVGSGGSSSGGTSGGGTSGGTTGGSSGALPFTCSYAMVVFSYGGKLYVMKVPQGWTTCTFTNRTSSDRNFTYECNGNTYSNDPDYVFSMNGSPVPTYTGPLPCSAFFKVSGREVWAKAGVTIIYAVAHNGSFPNHFATQCPSPNGVTYMAFPISCG